jgi:RNA polymerase sigma-70 factor (ECF subfamily)
VPEVDVDARCLEALDRGDLAGGATVVIHEYGPQLLGYLCSVLRSEADASEVFSMFSEDLWRGLSGFRRECPLRVWCYRLAWHAAARFLRDPYRERGRRLETGELSRLVQEVRSSVFLGRDQVRQATLDRLRATLSPDERTLLVLRLDRGLSWAEVSLVLTEAQGVPADEATLRKRFERLKGKLADRARAEGLIE